MVPARANPRMVVPSCLKSLDVMRDASACPELNIRQRRGLNLLQPHEATDGLILVPEGARVSAPAHASALEHVMAVCKPCENLDVLVDKQDRLSAQLELAQDLPDLAADDGSEPLGCFVQDQQLRVGHECARDR